VLSRKESIEKINKLATESKPFLFIIDFETVNCEVLTIKELIHSDIYFSIENFCYPKEVNIKSEKVVLAKNPISFNDYQTAFNIVQSEIANGNSYLVNLTFPTEISINLSLMQIYNMSNARFKLFYKNQFVVFSPEIFIEIRDNKISSFPMKGTIDASIKNAKEIIMEDEKEKAEHITIVDLIRNDLSIISSDVIVENFRFSEIIKTNQKSIIQISSKISGKLPADFRYNLGDLIFQLLPAGSISGAPKKKTLDIIHSAENCQRGFYTGVFGFFDGKNLKSAVMIRFIERTDEKLFFRSGGGITYLSDVHSEYQELIDKVYVPIY
jgi:para-aminobenzoate synthetase component 1